MIRPKYDPATHFVAQAARAILGSYYEDLVLFFLRLYWHCDQQDLLWRAPSTTPKFVVACITRRSNVLLTLFTSILCYYAALPKEKQPKFFSSAGLTCELHIWSSTISLQIPLCLPKVRKLGIIICPIMNFPKSLFLTSCFCTVEH